MGKRILISGAGVAGPALALCLARSGWSVTIVERAKHLRPGGQAVDFRGPVHRAVLERLDLWNAIHERRTRPCDLVLLKRDGCVAATMPSVMMSGDVEILRGDLSQLLHERTHRSTEYRFGDHLTALEEQREGVLATFASGAREEYDLVVGADGLHSGTRQLVLGDEATLLRRHGYRIASFATGNLLGARTGAVVYSIPGRAVCLTALGPDQGRALFVHAGGPLGPERTNQDAQRRLLRETFEDVGWETPRALDALDQATDLYVDEIATVHVPRYHQGKVALLGDSAWGGTLGGQGTSLAIVGAWVLANELEREADLSIALGRYEKAMRPYATRCQQGAMRAGQFFAPRSSTGLALRNLCYGALTSRPLLGFFEWLVKDAATDFVLPEYA